MQISILGILFFLLLVTVLVAAHELGHFLVAKLFRMQVEEFAIGFGRPFWVWMKRGDTKYTLRPIPLGGFVRTAGMEPKEDGSEINVLNGFYSKTPFQRFLMLLAGPIFSILAGIALLTSVFLAQGLPKFSEEPIVGIVIKGKIADQAGLKAGDRILEIEGKSVKRFYDAMVIIRGRPEIPTKITYERNGKTSTTTATPFEEEGPLLDEEYNPTSVVKKQGKLGMLPKQISVPTNLFGALLQAVQYPYQVAANLVTTPPNQLKDKVGGPISIFGAAQEQVKNGLGDMVFFAGVLSVSLGIINFFPVPPFDGGQMAVALVEMLRRGKRLSFKVQSAIFTAGFAVIVLLIVTLFTLDIGRLRQ